MPQIIHLEHTHSTNTYMRHLVETYTKPAEGTIVRADYQSAGRGQKGNSWESAAGANLLFTILLKPHQIAGAEQFIISQAVAVGVAEGLNACLTAEERAEGTFMVKWPNDIYYGNRKIAGILIENDLAGQTIFNSYVGIGLNVNQVTFESDAPNPVSLTQITGRFYELDEVLAKVLDGIFNRYVSILEGNGEAVRTAYRSMFYRNDGFHRYRDAEGDFEARVVDIEPSGYLHLEDRDGRQRSYWFKEVEFVIP
jgi:BirA family biotin operon repressor/biotin-[acetyl-CoA-carboxylase] ligase